MTVVESPEQKTASPPEADGAGAAAAAPAPSGRDRPRREMPVLQGVGIGVTLLAVLVLGFVGYLYGLSNVQEARTQTTLYAKFRGQLQQAVAPIGSPKAGSPVAVLDIPEIGLNRALVVEGTSGESLTRGPGHRRDTGLPGQVGVSEIYGRRATFGGPFARLPQLQPGDRITTITGQGPASYIVRAVSNRPILNDPSPNRLVLVTADSQLIPTHFIEVDADLVTGAKPTAGGRPIVTSAETALSIDFNALVLTMTWGLALALVSLATAVAWVRFGLWPAYLGTAPVLLAILWNLYENLSALLPNVF